jgi:integrase
MARRLPEIALHKASGQARVRINGKDHYLGVYGTPKVSERYDKLMAQVLSGQVNPDRDAITVSRLSIMYVDHSRVYYRKDGKQTSEVYAIQAALRPLTKLFGNEKVSALGPKKLKKVREQFIQNGAARSTINSHMQRIVRMLQWGMEDELVDESVYNSCKIRGLRKGRSPAKETEPVPPVPQPDIDAIELFVSREVWAMIQLQLVTGMRPGEVCQLRFADLDTSGKVWIYDLKSHKTAHHGKKRLINIGPKGQAILKPFMEVRDGEYVFSPKRAEAARNALKKAGRKSPMTPSQAAREAKKKPKRTAGDYYRRDSYARAITRACELAKIENKWSPNRLRHNAATELRKQFGIDVVRTILGHSSVDTTQVYAEIDYESARAAMEKAG